MAYSRDNDLGAAMPLYEEVKRVIYTKYQELSNAYAELLRYGNNKALSLNEFKRRYKLFYLEINDKNKLDVITKNKKKVLKDAFYIDDYITEQNSKRVMNYCSQILTELEINRIQIYKNNDWDAF